MGGLTPAAVAEQGGAGPITIPTLTGDPTTAAGKLSQLGLMPIPVNHLATVAVGKVAPFAAAGWGPQY